MSQRVFRTETMRLADVVVSIMHIFMGKKHATVNLWELRLPVLPLHPQLSISRNALNLCKIPFLIAQGADGSSFQPSLDAVQMKNMTTISKRDGKSVIIGRRRICLIFNARFVERISTNGAGISTNIP